MQLIDEAELRRSVRIYEAHKRYFLEHVIRWFEPRSRPVVIAMARTYANAELKGYDGLTALGIDIEEDETLH